MSIIEELESVGIELSDEEKEMHCLEETLSAEEDENIQLHMQVMRLKKELVEVKDERDELKESLIELDPDFGDIVLGSDRGNEMKYD